MDHIWPLPAGYGLYVAMICGNFMPMSAASHNSSQRNRPWVVAVTGGIASGKTAVTDGFRQHGISVWDADIAARAVVAPGSDGLAAIVRDFGHAMLQADGTLDRRALRRVVFNDASARKRLETMTHPRIHQWLLQHIHADTSPWCVLAIPLLVEAWERYRWVDRVLVVTAPRAVRVQRLMTRDAINRTEALAILRQQASDDARLAIADDVIDNSGNRQDLARQVAQMVERYTRLAAAV